MSRLPAATTSFVGRRRELTDLQRLLSDARLVTVAGAGGVGKTRLALRAAARVRPVFPDGVHLVELDALREPALLAQVVAEGVGLRAASVEPGERLTEYLADKRLLLVLDNCEHLVDECAAMVGTLLAAAPNLRVLATSRHLLGVEEEQVMRVAPLPVAEQVAGMARSAAVSLFVDRATAVDPAFVLDERNREQVLSICRRLDGVPLAIELAAVWVRALSVGEIMDRLDDRFTLLAKGSRTAPIRHQTLADTLDWSCQLCSRAERLLWARLSVFAGGFDIDAAEDVCTDGDIDRTQIPSLIESLVDKSILVAQPDRRRYRMSESVREYGLGLLTASGHEVIFRTRHGRYYRELARRYDAESFGPRQIEWIQHLLSEHPNIRTALEFALTGSGRAEIATEMASTMREFWYSGGLLCEGYRWLRRALVLDTEPTSRRGHALWACSFIGVSLGEVEAASEMLTECAELAETLDEPVLRADHALGTGFAALRRGDTREATALLERAVAGYRKIGGPRRLLNSLIVLAMANLFGRHERGVQAAAEALELCQAHKATWQECYALYAVAVHEWRSSRYRQGEALLRRAIRGRSAVPDWSVLAQMVEVLAWCVSASGRSRRAARLLGAAHAVYRHSGIRAGILPFRVIDDQIADNACAEIGVDQFHAEFNAGLGYSIEQVVEEALRTRTPTPPSRARTGTASPLTRRQSQIAELIAQGLTNREIAGRLTIAQRTADAHVANLLTKLGFTTRAQVATWVVGIGLD
jgi:predicted ATPase/DNA-binding CsgD family transcriptional regulator